MAIKARLKKLEITFQCDELAKEIATAKREKIFAEHIKFMSGGSSKRHTSTEANSEDRAPTWLLNKLLGINDDNKEQI